MTLLARFLGLSISLFRNRLGGIIEFMIGSPDLYTRSQKDIISHLNPSGRLNYITFTNADIFAKI